MKLIGLDVGTVRIGVATADTGTRIAVPAGAIAVNGQEFVELAKLARTYNTNVFILGMPRNNAGEETQQSAYVRAFAAKLSQTIPGVKIYFQDESLTSVEAEERLKARKKNYQKAEIDAEAAAIILQDCIEYFTSAGKPKPGAVTKVSNKAQTAAAADEVATVEAATKKAKKSSGKKRGKVIAIVVVAIVAILGVAFGGVALWYNNMIAAKVTDIECKYDSNETQIAAEEEIPEACEFIRFTIAENQSVAEIGDHLETAGVIKSGFAFQLYVRFAGLAASLQSGEYDFRQTMSVLEIAEAIKNGDIADNTFNFTILPGETLNDVRRKLLEEGYNATDITAAFTKHYNSPVLAGLYDVNGNMINSGQPVEYQLEGYLYGETYQFYKNERLENIIQRTLDEFEEVVKGNNLEAKFSEKGLTLREGIILASIVQKEAKSADMPGVAQVFLNRLRQGMALGSDVTASYAADLTDPERSFLTDNLAILGNDNLYNTRLHAGLPPGPISQPSITALLAVANPDEAHAHDLFFLTGDDGVMYYSDSAEGHAQNAADYCKELCQVTL